MHNTGPSPQPITTAHQAIGVSIPATNYSVRPTTVSHHAADVPDSSIDKSAHPAAVQTHFTHVPTGQLNLPTPPTEPYARFRLVSLIPRLPSAPLVFLDLDKASQLAPLNPPPPLPPVSTGLAGLTWQLGPEKLKQILPGFSVSGHVVGTMWSLPAVDCRLGWFGSKDLEKLTYTARRGAARGGRKARIGARAGAKMPNASPSVPLDPLLRTELSLQQVPVHSSVVRFLKTAKK